MIEFNNDYKEINDDSNKIPKAHKGLTGNELLQWKHFN